MPIPISSVLPLTTMDRQLPTCPSEATLHLCTRSWPLSLTQPHCLLHRSPFPAAIPPPQTKPFSSTENLSSALFPCLLTSLLHTPFHERIVCACGHGFLFSHLKQSSELTTIRLHPHHSMEMPPQNMHDFHTVESNGPFSILVSSIYIHTQHESKLITLFLASRTPLSCLSSNLRVLCWSLTCPQPLYIEMAMGSLSLWISSQSTSIF